MIIGLSGTTFAQSTTSEEYLRNWKKDFQSKDAPRKNEIKKVEISDEDKVSECIDRGIQYFDELGSYPTLSNGQDARKTATERCNRTTTAF